MRGWLGGGGTSTPVPVPQQMLEFDRWVLLGITCGLGLWVRYLKSITRLAGVAFLGGYAAYIFWLYAPSGATS